MSEKTKLKAGPPSCKDCGAIMELWTKMFVKTIGGGRPIIWLCPNKCEFHKTEDQEDGN